MAIQIVRGAAATHVRRDAVAQGQVFGVPNRAGRCGTQYAAIGANGRHYSVNLSNGVLASSGNPTKNCKLLGKWKFNVTKARHLERNTTRSQVRPGEVFVVANGTKEYANMGRITKDHNGWLSIPLANQQNHAYTENGDSKVRVIGIFRMDVTPVA